MQNEQVENSESSAIDFQTNEISNSPASESKISLPDNPPWNSWTALGVWLASVFFIVIFPNVIIGVYLLKNNLSFSQPEQLQEFFRSDVTVNILKVLSIIPAHILTLCVAWLVVTNLNKFSFKETLGWKFGGFRLWHAFAITIFMLVLGGILVSKYGQQENELTIIVKSSLTATILVALMATFTAPIVEEVVYRGILYSALQRSFGIIAAVALVTFLFALVHVPQNITDPVAISIITLLSLILTLIRMKTGNLLPCIVLHFIFNGVQSVFLIIQPFLEQKSGQSPASLIYKLFN